MKRILSMAFAFTLALVIAPSMAGATSCPFDMRAIDAALQSAKLTPQQRAQVQNYRRQGEQLHRTGKRGAAVATFAKAKAILKI